MNRILAQARIELIQITRDRMALILILALPVILLIVIGSAITLKVSHLPIVIQDFDGSGTSFNFLCRGGNKRTTAAAMMGAERKP